MNTISGLYTPRLKCLRPVLQSWIALNKEIVKSWNSENDVPWWYNERASLSVLAGAVWRIRGRVLEEYSNGKRGISRKTGKLDQHYRGRIDIFMEFGSHEFKGEAKACWPAASNRNADPTRFISASLKQARQDIRKCPGKGVRRLAIVFAAPYISKRQKENMGIRIETFVEAVQNQEADAFAWVFPESTQGKIYNGWIYPGAAVVIREVKR